MYVILIIMGIVYYFGGLEGVNAYALVLLANVSGKVLWPEDI